MNIEVINKIHEISTSNPVLTNREIASIVGCYSSVVQRHREPRTHAICKTCGCVIAGGNTRRYCSVKCRPSYTANLERSRRAVKKPKVKQLSREEITNIALARYKEAIYE